MFHPLFRIILLIDRWLASPDCRRNAQLRAAHTVRVHGEASLAHLADKLGDNRRRKSRREIRLAMLEILRLHRAPVLR